MVCRKKLAEPIRQVLNSIISRLSILGIYITQVTNLWQMEVLPSGRLEIIMMEMTMKYGIRNIINSMRRWAWPIKQVRFLLFG
ncbi:hypothetical protein D3C81_1362330 [compost metagenome]